MEQPYALAAQAAPHRPASAGPRQLLLARRGLLALALLLAGLSGCSHAPTAAPRAGRAGLLAEPYQPGVLRLALPTGLPAAAKATPVPADTSAAGMAAIWADVRRRSYFLAADAAEAGPRRATNVAQRLTAHLRPAAYTLAATVPLSAEPAAAAPPAWQVGFTLRGIGRAGDLTLRPAAAPTVAATDTSVRYQHGAAFTVEYTNTPAGVRQNYYLSERPAGLTGPVQVQLTLDTKLQPAADGPGISFAPAGGGAAVLRYDHLRAWDATGRVLPSRLCLDGPTALALVVDDADATYPVTIDPLASTAGTTLTGQNAGDTFATSVALVGDLNGDGYGELAVGAPAFSAGAGCVYIYRGSSTGLVPTAATQLIGSGTDNYGTSVAGAGDFNGDGYDDFAFGGPAFNANAGSVAIVFGNAGLGVGTSTATAGGAVGYRLGVSLTGLGDTNGDGYADLAVGAPGVSSALVVRGANATAFAGFSAFYLSPTGGTTAGTSVAGPGDVNGDGLNDVLLGAPGAGTSGSVYLFLGSAGLSGISVQDAVFSTATAGENFGQAVAGAGDINGDGYGDFVVGAPAYAANKGRVYVSLGTAVLVSTAYTPQIIDGAVAGDQFGSSLSGGDANGDGYGDVLVGAPAYSSSTGRAYAYYGSPAALLTTPTATLAEPSAANNNLFGISTASAGDVNGDGYGDVLVGASGTSSNRGQVYLYLGSATGLATTPTVLIGVTANNYFGFSVAGASDVDGDGYSDVLVGAYGTSGNQGRAYLYRGSASGLVGTPTALIEPGAASGNNFGFSVAGAGDVDGDGYADVLVGAYLSSNQGRAYLYRGSSTGLVATPTTLIAPGATANDLFGFSVASAGDVNGDGFADVLVGSYGNNNNRGLTYLYRGTATGLAATPTTLAEPGALPNNYFGVSVASAGDVDGDGFADVLVGASGNSSNQGRTYLYRGSSTGLATTPTATLTETSAAANNQFGRSVASAGDVDGDGYSDVLVGALGTSSNQGRTYLYRGGTTGLAATATALAEPGAAANNQFGRSVAGAGDVDGDAYSDVLVGASGTSSSQGRTYLYGGNQGEARVGGLRLYNTDLSTPISASNRPNAQFGIGLTARNPAGRIRARLVWEVVRPGTSFSNPTALPTSTAYSGRGAWTALPASGTAPELKALVAKTGRASRARARLEYASSPLPATTPPNGVGGPASRLRYGPWTYVAAQQLGQSTSAATPLPVELTDFTATAEDSRAVRLAWATASEKNSAAFAVERSVNGRDFSAIGTVAAAGTNSSTSSSARSYELLDAKLPAGAATLYYRLKQVDVDGTFSYSPVRAVSLKAAAGLSLYPNPATTGATLTGALPGTVVMVYDALGRLVTSATADATGTAALVLPAGLPAGVYVVRAGTQALRLTVE